MRRRTFIGALGGAAVWPLATRAQQTERVVRIGYLSFVSASRSQREDNAFREGLRDLGYIEGRNLRFEYRSAEGDESRLPALLVELIGLNVDIIVTQASGVFAAMRVTKTVPIVMAVGPDLVALGLVNSLARPGGNVTGSTFFVPEIMAKRLELLREVAPAVEDVGVLLFRRGDNANANILQSMGVTAQALKLQLHPVEVRGPEEFDAVFSAWADRQVGSFIMNEHAVLIYNVGAIAEIAAKRRLLAIGPLSLPESGGLAGYGVNFPEIFRRAAYFVDKIWKGTKPGDIPIEQATKFRTIINLKTARNLGIDIPPIQLARADDVIE